MIVEDYLNELTRNSRCTTVESVHAAIKTMQIFEKAIILDSVMPDFGVADQRAKLSAKLKAYVDKNVKQFKQLLNDCKFLEVFTVVTCFEELTAQYPEMHEFENINFQGKFT